MSLRSRLAFSIALVGIPLVVLLTMARGHMDYAAEVESLHQFIAARMQDGRAACEADPARFPPPPGGPQAGRPGAGRPGGGRPRAGAPGEPPRLRDGPGPSGRRGPRDGQGAGPDGPRGERRPNAVGRPPRQEVIAARREGPPVELFAYGTDYVSANPRAPRFPIALRRKLEGSAQEADMRLAGTVGSGIRVAAKMPWGTGPAAIVMATRYGEGPAWLSRNQLITGAALAFALVAAVFLACGPLVSRLRRLTDEVGRVAGERYSNPVLVSGNDEIADLARAFNDASAEIRRQFDAVEQREQALRSFVANTTHDVMIPMTVLQGHLSALGESGSEPNPGRLKDAMEEVQYMASLIQNLSASAKLESGAQDLSLADVDMNALIERVVARHTPIARQRKVEINFGVPASAVVVQGDVTLLEQAVSNLVQNAVRYVAEGGHVALLLDQDGSTTFRLRVIDDGPGIEEAEMQAHMQRSFRGDAARSRYPEGEGLGLHIALEVARRHEFDIEMLRSEYGGLEVRLSGPVSR